MRRAFALFFVGGTASCVALAGLDDLEAIEQADSGLPDRAVGEDGGKDVIGLVGEDGAAQADGGANEDAAMDAAQTDAVADANPGTCSLPTNDTLTKPLNNRWKLRGAAVASDPAGVNLVPDLPLRGGALYWDEVLSFTRIDATFSYKIVSSGGGIGTGDGVAFAWIKASGAPGQMPKTGGELGVGSQEGYAVAVDAYTNTEYSDSPTPAITVKNTMTMLNIASSPIIPSLANGGEHVIRVQLANGTLNVSVDNAPALGPVVLSGYQPFNGVFGFGAGTGGAQALHVLTNATVRVGTSGPCAAP